MCGEVAVFRDSEVPATITIKKADGDDTVRLAYGPWLQGDGIKYGKETGIDADCAAKCEKRSGREGRRATHGAERIRGILPKAFEPGLDPDCAGILARQRYVANRGWRDAVSGEHLTVVLDFFGEVGSMTAARKPKLDTTN